MLRARLPLLLALLLPALAAAASADPIADEAAALRQEALRTAGGPRGAAALFRLHALRDEVEDLAPLAQTFALLSERSSAAPLTRSTARLLLLDVERARGRLPRAAELSRQLGFLTRFYVVGGFDNEGKGGCDTDFGPESAELSLASRYAAAGGREVGWQKLAEEPTDGYVDLSAALRPAQESVGYALTVLEAPTDTTATFALGTSGAFRLWVNGQKVAAEERYNQPRPDQARVSVRLKKGQNRLLLKVCQESGPFGFYLRQERGGGAPLLEAQLPDTLPALPKGAPAAPQRLPTLATLLEKEVQKSPQDAPLRADWAMVLAATSSFEARERTATVEAEKAALAAPKDAPLQLLAARLHGEDHNERRRFLERALAADATFPQARVMLAEHELSRGHPERALALTQALLAEAPAYAAARLVQVRALDLLGEDARAHTTLEEALQALPRSPLLVREAARAALRLGRVQQARERLRLALALRYDDAPSRTTLLGMLADAGDVPGAARELRTQVALEPFSLSGRLRLAELLIANGQAEEGLAAFAAARQVAGEDAELAEREGRALLMLGRREEALASLERALALRPQNPALREALRGLRGEAAGLGEAHLLDVAPLVKEADAFAGEDLVYLADNTYVRVQPTGQSSRLHQLAVKVYSQRGVNAFRSFPISYAPARQEVRVLKARITKPDGAVVEAFGESERQINEPWTGMYYDARARVLSFPALAPGDVLELRYRLDDTAPDNLLSDYWGDVESVQSVAPKVRFQYLVDMPEKRPLYWNEGELPGVAFARTQPEAGRTLYTWTAKSVPRVVPEPSMPGWAEVSRPLHVSTYKSWEQVGRYYWGLVRDQLAPTDELKRTVDEVLKGVDRKDELAVVRALYSFVVTNTRYVALEFGIHGYKPYRVDRVLSRRFGDCKDKASLIHALLKVAGVDSRLVLLRMRDLGSLSGSPASLAAFNHAILYVPRYDLWLDGTAEFHGARELPGADRLANVLVVEPGGKSSFLTIPEARAADNLTTLTLSLSLQKDASARLEGENRVSGQQAPEWRRAYRAEATRTSTFERTWGSSFPGLAVEKVEVNDTTKLDEDVSVRFVARAPRLVEVFPDGSMRVFAFGTPRTFTQAFAPLAERRYDVLLSMPWTQRATYRFRAPAGHRLVELPREVHQSSPFGQLTLRYRQEGEEVVAESELVVEATRVKPEQYPAFRSFLLGVDQAFGQKLTFRPTSTTAGR